MNKNTTSRNKHSARQAELKQLLAPIAEFFIRAGFDAEEIQRATADSISLARRRKRAFVVRRVGNAELYAAMIRRWTVEPSFTNETGRPATLPIKGNKSFTALARVCGYRGAIGPLMLLMQEHGSIQINNNNVDLILSHMRHYRRDVLSYEWNYQFLCDAITAATRGMGKPKSQERLLVSFVNVAGNVAEKHVAPFLAESHRRNVAFAGELSPWLEHVTRRNKTGRRRGKSTYRLGVGVFPICSRE